MEIIGVILVVLICCVLAVKLYLCAAGMEKVVVKTKQRTPFKVVEQTEDSITLSTKLEFANEGKQCATIMDCIVRTLLPYEQYDGIRAQGKAELEGVPREDDYFEAVLIQKQESIFINAFVKLTARKGMDLKTALSQMVDLPMDIIYMETGRNPWKYSKVRVILTAGELAGLAGAELADD